MLKKVEGQEIMTVHEALGKYRTQYFVMFITEIVDKQIKDRGYVMYVADKRNELREVSQDEYRGKRVAFLYGDDTDPYPSIGNIVYHDKE